VSAAAHSLEAGGNFPTYKKKSRRVSLADSFFAARQARSGHRGHVSEATHAPEAGGNFPANKKTTPSKNMNPRISPSGTFLSVVVLFFLYLI